MNLEKSTIARRLAALALAAALAFGGLQGLGSHDDPSDVSQTQEVAGGTWSRIAPAKGKGGGATINGGTWS